MTGQWWEVLGDDGCIRATSRNTGFAMATKLWYNMGVAAAERHQRRTSVITQLPAVHVNAATREPIPQYTSPDYPGILFWNRSTITWLQDIRKQAEQSRRDRMGRPREVAE